MTPTNRPGSHRITPIHDKIRPVMLSQRTRKRLIAMHIINATPGPASVPPTVLAWVLIAIAVGAGVLLTGVMI